MAAGGQQLTLGPDGGDVRSLEYDPHNPDRVFLGTSSGELFLSTDNGRSWAHLSRVSDRDDFVVDNILIDPRNSNVIFVGAWSVESQASGDVFRSQDGGKTWQVLSGMHNKSVRAMAMAASNPDVLVAGALDGVFRSRDAGASWEKITPASGEVKNIESIAVDPKNPNVVYAGTWHLAWKTDNGGATWHHINKGMIDDSDVFSIIVDPSNPSVVFASACSGIYKSEQAGELFQKIQGIPFSARRTRVLHHDPSNPNVVYAGTTEGLWKTTDQGKTWRRVTNPEVVVNDVHVDPRNPNHVLLATDRSGVMATEDGAGSWVTSNKGYAHRLVQTVLVDHQDKDVVYAGLANDRDFGGVFVSNDEGQHWQQRSAGLGGRDVFALRQAGNGALVAGTHRGIFILDHHAREWRSANVVVKETATTRTVVRKGKRVAVTTKSSSKYELTARVKDLDISGERWLAATSEGLLTSVDQGKIWIGGPVLGNQNLVAAKAEGRLLVAATNNTVLVSPDGGASWKASSPAKYITKIYGVAFGPDSQILVASREGAFRSNDRGNSWEHLIAGLPATEISSLQYRDAQKRFFATGRLTSVVFESADGRTWQRKLDMGYPVTALAFSRSNVIGATLYNGVVAKTQAGAESSASAGSLAGSTSNK